MVLGIIQEVHAKLLIPLVNIVWICRSIKKGLISWWLFVNCPPFQLCWEGGGAASFHVTRDTYKTKGWPHFLSYIRALVTKPNPHASIVCVCCPFTYWLKVVLTSVLKMALSGVPLRATYRDTLKEDYLSKYGSNLQLGCLGSLTNECASFQQTANRMRLFNFHR